MRDKKARGPEDSFEIRKPVQVLDTASVAKRLREEKTYEDHGRSVLSLYHVPSLRAALTAIAAGRRTGERRVACLSTVHVLEGEVKFKAGEERHVLSVGGTLLLEGNVPYEAEALSDATFLHTVVQPVEEGGVSRSRCTRRSPWRGVRTWTSQEPIALWSSDLPWRAGLPGYPR